MTESIVRHSMGGSTVQKSKIIVGDCLDKMMEMETNSVDSIVTDPPYGLSFMGKDWDHGVPGVAFWREALRVLKPGGHMLAFGGTRTFHRLVCAIEDAGFEIRDQIMWLYGSGFPKGCNFTTQFDEALLGIDKEEDPKDWEMSRSHYSAHWEGFNVAIKPAHEPICVARKPLGTVDTNVLEVVELNLRSQGVTGEIRWTKENASDAGRSKETISFGSTKHSEPSETSAKSAAANATLRTEQQTPLCTVRDGTHGGGKTNHTIGNTAESWTSNCANKFSLPTEAPAHAAENASRLFLPLTTLTEEGQHTGAQSMGRSTPNYGEKDTQKAIACFAGIATGLTGSLAHVHITRLNDGSFVWPHDLPKFVPAAPLTVAANVLKWGTGALNVDGCRVRDGSESGADKPKYEANYSNAVFGMGMGGGAWENTSGRWPANVIHDGSPEVVVEFPGEGDKSASRFFYAPKASKKDRDEGLEHLPELDCGMMEDDNYAIKTGSGNLRDTKRRNTHPTVKPTDLMRYLCRLVTPPGGLVLDPFAGSGSTGKAAVLEGFRFIGIELSEEYAVIGEARIADASNVMKITAKEEKQLSFL